MASRKDGATYIGVTSNLAKRIYEYKHEIIKGHTSKYNIKKLVFFELHDSAESAITRETQIKTWKRAWKIELIEQENPHWDDLYNTII